jgi:hypothetical protein
MSQKKRGSCLSHSQRVRASTAGVLRAGLVFGLIITTLCALSLRSAEARAGESLRGFASELLSWKSAKFASEPRNLWLNGAQLHFVSASSPLSVSETLDRLEDVCQRRGGLVGAQRALSMSRRPIAHASASWLRGAFREESEREGFVACLDTGGALGPGELAKRIHAFASTGNLADLGELRYVLARRAGDTTTALVLWTEGEFPLLRMFPDHGDAPGVDPLGIPRPGQADRVLSATERDAPYSLTLYRVPSGQTAALADYLDGLRRGGWSVTLGRQPNAAVARHGDRTVFISAEATSPQKSTLSVFALS